MTDEERAELELSEAIAEIARTLKQDRQRMIGGVTIRPANGRTITVR